MEIREINDAEIEEALSLHNEHYGEARTTQQWLWEYRGNVRDRFVFRVAKNDGHIVGTQGMIPIYLNIKGKRYLTGKSENTFIDQKRKIMGLFSHLYENAMSSCQEKNMSCVWGFTRLGDLWRKMLRFTVYDDVMFESILVFGPLKALPEISSQSLNEVVKMAFAILAVPLKVYSLLLMLLPSIRLRDADVAKYETTGRLRTGDDMQQLYNRLRARYPNLVHLEQDEPYVAWRIHNNPNVRYTTIFVYEGEVLRGYSYLSKNNKNTVFLSDLTFENEETGKLLLEKILAHCRQHRVGMVYYIGNSKNQLNANVFSLLKRAGFLMRRNSQAFVLRNISYEDGSFISGIENWYANGLWSEGYNI